MTEVVTIRDAEIAQQLVRPREVPTEPTGTCVCGEEMKEVLITTGGPMSDANLWRDVPIAVDGWVCGSCATLRYPRVMTPQEITAFMNEGVEHGRAGSYADAELCFLRAVWDWPGYPPAHLNYAEATRSRLHITEDHLIRDALEARMIEHYAEGVANAASSSPAVARAYLTLVGHATQTQAFDRARRFLTRLAGLPNVDEETQGHAAEMLAYIEQRIDLFEAAAQVLMPLIELSDRPAQPLDAEQKKAVADAIAELEVHLQHAPDRWQSAWLHAKALFAAERTADGFAAFARASERFPDRVEIARDYSQCLLKAERAPEARDVNRAIVALHPDDAAMHCNLAVCELLCGDVEAATRAIARCRSLDPDDQIAPNVERRIARGGPFPTTFLELARGG